MRANTKRGFSLIEASIVLAIVGLVIGGLWVAASSVREYMRVNSTSSAIITGIQNMRKLLPISMATGPYTALSDSFLISAKVFPADFVDGSRHRTPWNTNLAAGTTGSGSAAFLQIDVELPDKASCLRMTSSISSRFRDNTDLAYIIIGTPYTLHSTWPLSVTGGQCDGITPPYYVSYLFTFN